MERHPQEERFQKEIGAEDPPWRNAPGIREEGLLTGVRCRKSSISYRWLPWDPSTAPRCGSPVIRMSLASRGSRNGRREEQGEPPSRCHANCDAVKPGNGRRGKPWNQEIQTETDTKQMRETRRKQIEEKEKKKRKGKRKRGQKAGNGRYMLTSPGSLSTTPSSQ